MKQLIKEKATIKDKTKGLLLTEKLMKECLSHKQSEVQLVKEFVFKELNLKESEFESWLFRTDIKLGSLFPAIYIILEETPNLLDLVRITKLK